MLVPSAGLALSLDAGYAPEEVATGLRGAPVQSDLVGQLTRETIGRGKVERGLVHPYYTQLGKALLKTWDADRAVFEARPTFATLPSFRPKRAPASVMPKSIAVSSFLLWYCDDSRSTRASARRTASSTFGKVIVASSPGFAS